jgi:hypothetical protein
MERLGTFRKFLDRSRKAHLECPVQGSICTSIVYDFKKQSFFIKVDYLF